MDAMHECCRWAQRFFAVVGDCIMWSMLTCGTRAMAARAKSSKPSGDRTNHY
jgi:hypothetical protein